MENGLSDKLKQAMTAVNELNKSIGVTQRGGKQYTEVFVRVEEFRKAFGLDFGIETDIIKDDGKFVQVRSLIKDTEGRVIGSGMAEEIRGSSNVNKTSALENCETSAIGRALASIALHGGQYASLNEVVQAEEKEKIIDAAPKQETPPVKTDSKFVDYAKKLTERFMECKTTQEVVDLNNKHTDRLRVVEQEDPVLFKNIHDYKNQRFDELMKGKNDG
mgnify:CR=1 FL=1|tara:strand:- start:3292 stop:3945 length:654 start_codon:yes stop_codon:yes gene_type:complete